MRLLNPEGLPPPAGFSHVAVTDAGLAFIAGQTAADPQTGKVDAALNLCEQFDRALASVVRAAASIGAAPTSVAQLRLLVTDADAYRSSLSEIGAIYRSHLGRHYPATTFEALAGLFDPAALVEIEAIVELGST